MIDRPQPVQSVVCQVCTSYSNGWGLYSTVRVYVIRIRIQPCSEIQISVVVVDTVVVGTCHDLKSIEMHMHLLKSVGN